jgi:NAD(P)-dependent dehydrogenase (short-subunit alcohol dehydrogenase family)
MSSRSLRNSPHSIITGAGSGFGRALAVELARYRGRLVLSDINLAGLQETAALARSAGATSVTTLRCDVSQLADVEALATAAGSAPIDLVVNNAGISCAGLVGDVSIADWRKTIDIDLWGVIYGCHVFTPILRRQGHGAILNVASAAGLLAAPRMAPYNVAKAGVVSLSETLSAELLTSGVSVTVLCPTFFRTNIAVGGLFADEHSKRLAEKMVSRGRPVEEVVAAALHSVEHSELYCVPMADARWFWRAKRVLPGSFRSVLHLADKFLYKKRQPPR